MTVFLALAAALLPVVYVAAFGGLAWLIDKAVPVWNGRKPPGPVIPEATVIAANFLDLTPEQRAELMREFQAIVDPISTAQED